LVLRPENQHGGNGVKHILVSLFLIVSSTYAHAHTLTFSTEDYPPYSFTDANGNARGVYMEQLEIMMEKEKLDYKVTVMPWARALALAETQSMHCVFATARTAEREHKFKWVVPLHTDRNVLIALKAKKIRIGKITDSFGYTIGTQRNDYTETVLRQIGFPNIELSADFNLTLNKLFAGRIDMMPMSESTFIKIAKGTTNFEKVFTLSDQILGVACNKSVPDSIIARMQKRLDDLITDGTQRKIFEKYGLIIHNDLHLPAHTP
jgi:polar amino acid transport system substrate-binding protein